MYQISETKAGMVRYGGSLYLRLDEAAQQHLEIEKPKEIGVFTEHDYHLALCIDPTQGHSLRIYSKKHEKDWKRERCQKCMALKEDCKC